MKWFLYGILGAFLTCNVAIAHEMVPTYPEFKHSHVSGVLKTTVKMFNKRDDVEYYEIGVFDQDFNPVPFVSSYKIFKLKYLGHMTIDIYIKSSDKDKVTYICSRSKLRKEDKVRTAISSKICSKVK
jgi:hypothetical protein